MTFARLLADLQDAWRQALADGPRGWGRRGWFEVRNEGGTMRVILTISAERGCRLYAAVSVALDAEVLEIWAAADVVSELLRVAARYFRGDLQEAIGEIGTVPPGRDVLWFRSGDFCLL